MSLPHKLPAHKIHGYGAFSKYVERTFAEAVMDLDGSPDVSLDESVCEPRRPNDLRSNSNDIFRGVMWTEECQALSTSKISQKRISASDSRASAVPLATASASPKLGWLENGSSPIL